MTSRVLPLEEWSRLAGTELDAVWPHLNPETARVLVVEDAGAIVGTWALFHVVHAEGVWIAETHRGKTAVARRLLKAMRQAATEMGAAVVATAALTPDVEGYLATLGAVTLPGTHYALSVGRTERCQQP